MDQYLVDTVSSLQSLAPTGANFNAGDTSLLEGYSVTATFTGSPLVNFFKRKMLVTNVAGTITVGLADTSVERVPATSTQTCDLNLNGTNIEVRGIVRSAASIRWSVVIEATEGV